MRNTASILRVSIPVLLILTSCAQATQIIYRSPQQMGRESTHIVQGTVTGVRSYWNGSHTKILTETRVAVERSYKGGAGGDVGVVQLGGTVGHVQMKVEGALDWSPGEEVLLFLEPFTDDRFMIYGLSQGKYDIERDGSGRPFVSRASLDDVEMLSAPGAGSARMEKVPLEAFINKALGDR
jgi:hypothetical protein